MRISKQQIEALEKIVKSGITKDFYLAADTSQLNTEFPSS